MQPYMKQRDRLLLRYSCINDTIWFGGFSQAAYDRAAWRGAGGSHISVATMGARTRPRWTVHQRHKALA
jgi:hypothetical protein